LITNNIWFPYLDIKFLQSFRGRSVETKVESLDIHKK
jgi:hypothetical protein